MAPKSYVPVVSGMSGTADETAIPKQMPKGRWCLGKGKGKGKSGVAQGSGKSGGLAIGASHASSSWQAPK
eukprot:9237655-Karenia_brevis.AAC.1